MTSHRRVVVVGTTLVVLAGAASSAIAQWPQFRGPNGSGVGEATGYPVEFSPAKNVVWKAAVPYGQSSPVVVGTRVYLTASEGDRLLTICLEAGTGRELWRREIRRERAATIYPANDPASPTPVADEHGVVAFFADFGLVAYTPEGGDRWSVRLGPFKNFYGMAASPVIAGDLLVMVCDQQGGSFAIAVDRRTGSPRWKTERGGATPGWATPMVFRPTPGAEEQLIVLGSTRLDAYALATGEPRWFMPLASAGGLGTAVAMEHTLFVSTWATNDPWMPAFASVIEKYDTNKDGRLSHAEFRDDPEMGGHFGWVDTDSDDVVTAEEWNTARKTGIGEYGAVALRPGIARGELDAKAILWRFKKNLPYIPAPLAYQGVFYLVKDGGIVTSVDAASGQLLKEGRSRNALGEYRASPVAADGKVFLASTEGKISVLRAAAQWEVLGVNDLGEEVHATPALAHGRIFVRTRSAVYCFGAS